MKKVYEAYVVIKLKDYFEEKLRENEATMLSRILVINSNNNEPLYYYTAIMLGLFSFIFQHTKTIVKDSPLMGKNSIHTKLELLQIAAALCTRFMRRNLRWGISRVSI